MEGAYYTFTRNLPTQSRRSSFAQEPADRRPQREASKLGTTASRPPSESRWPGLHQGALDCSALLDVWEMTWFARNLFLPGSETDPSSGRHLAARAAPPSVQTDAPTGRGLEDAAQHSTSAPSLSAAVGSRRGRGRRSARSASSSRPKRSSSVDASHWMRGGGGGFERLSAGELGGERSISENECISTARADGGGCANGAATLRGGKPLTEMDLEELRGFFDLGFKFSGADLSPRMTATLPALELYQAVESVQQRLLQQQRQRAPPLPPASQSLPPPPPPPPPPPGSTATFAQIPPTELGGLLAAAAPSPPEQWIIPSASYRPADMKSHLRVWAQTVACTVRQAC